MPQIKDSVERRQAYSVLIQIDETTLYLAEVLCRGAAAAVIVFDLTNEESFKKAQSWVKELQKMGNPNMIMSLAGNKADLADQRAVSSEDAKVCDPSTQTICTYRVWWNW